MNYTKQQQEVIDARKCNILVSAAAGSGKTAVLVERIIGLIREGIDVDTLLVVTFTEAAAAQMRERLRNKLSEIAAAEPENRHIQKQTVLIHNAQITTIHGFCLTVIKNHFQEISLEPGFRVADEGEMKLMLHDVMEDMLEAYYLHAEPDFLAFAERYAQVGDTEKLSDMIIRLYNDAMSHAFWEERLEQCRAELTYETIEDLEQADWMKYIYAYEDAVLRDCHRLAQKAVKLCNESSGPLAYLEALMDDLEHIDALMQKRSHIARSHIFASWKFMDLSRKRSDMVDEEKKKLVKLIRDEIKKQITDLRKKLYTAPPESELLYQNRAGETAEMAVRMTLDFCHRFSAMKREKNIIDFTDMEHLALQILLTQKDGIVMPTETATEYQNYFTEILTDEYQDSNDVQELLLWSVSKESSGAYNRFMVGDVKQSIYRFRLARPEIFMQKYDTYKNGDEKKRKIILSQNFRSRNEVIDSVNYVFERIMTKDLGNIDYDEDARLYCGATFPDAEQGNFDTELLLYEKSVGKTEEEAFMIARRICAMVGQTLVTDTKTQQLRPAEYRDIVILLRTAKGVDEVFRKVFEKSGIPVHISSASGYFMAQEVRTVINYITLLVNPRQDIPLHGVLHSVLGDFSEKEIAQIRAEGGTKGQLLDSLTGYVAKHMESRGTKKQLADRIQSFLDDIERYRACAAYMPVYQLIQKIFHDKKYVYLISALPGGEQRRANLKMLLEYAKKFESTSFSGLFDFIRYLQMLKQREIDFGEANIVDENANVVRIMTIHKSKGLEFPICIVAQLGRKLSQREFLEPLLTDPDIGIGNRYIDLDMRFQTDTLRRNAIICKQRCESRGEDFRILYVAMTRAKEKLILTGRVGKLEKAVTDAIASLEVRDKTLTYTERIKAGTYLDLLIPVMARQKSFKKLSIDLFEIRNPLLVLPEETGNIRIDVISAQDVEVDMTAQTIEKGFLEEHLLSESAKETDFQIWEERFCLQYAHQGLAGLYTKTTVSELKHAAYHEAVFEETMGEGSEKMFSEPEEESYIPKFARTQTEVAGVTRGTAYHRIMELLEFSKLFGHEEEFLLEQKEQILNSHKMTAEMMDLISEEKILIFLRQDLARRMAKARRKQLLFREQPFVLGVPANEANPAFSPDERLLIQGVIDVYFEEDGELVLADYKTDKVKTPEELIHRYRTQLDYYERALVQLTGKPVKERLIYSFGLGLVITV